MRVFTAVLLLASMPLIAKSLSPDHEMSVFAAEGANYCAGASWENTKLYDFLYSLNCIPEGWEDFFGQEAVSQQVQAISMNLGQQMSQDGDRIMPLLASTFKAMDMVPPHRIKAVILGQDPAPQYGLATGMSFSIPANYSTSLVPSIQRVLLEARNEGFDVKIKIGDLTSWAEQGVLLLNSALTIPCRQGDAYCEIGGDQTIWSDFTAALFKYLNTNAPPSAFILWGEKAGKYQQYIDSSKIRVLRGGHPSPRAKGEYFFCGNYFQCANKWLGLNNLKPVNWSLARESDTEPVCVWGWNSHGKESYCEHHCEEKLCDF
ncbi:MAG: uracil-DNA glycosylase [Endozoicomonas sp.]